MITFNKKEKDIKVEFDTDFSLLGMMQNAILKSAIKELEQNNNPDTDIACSLLHLLENISFNPNQTEAFNDFISDGNIDRFTQTFNSPIK